MAAITIFTQVYNTAPYIRQCVESVLGQSFPDFEYVLIDNGSTDGCKEILEQYAQKDARIRLLRFEENAPGRIWTAAESIGDSPYFSALDSDDWIESNYLESLLSFAENQDLDIACTGTRMHEMVTGNQYLRNVPSPLILERDDLSSALPTYHVFFRTHWNKLIRFDILRTVRPSALPAIYGRDTLICFHCLRYAKRIGIDNSILHHYRVHKKSISYQYNPKRFEADICLYNDAIDFLSAFGPVSVQNRSFLQCVYSNAIVDTTGVIQNAKLSPSNKLREYLTIAAHPITLAAYRECADESAARSKTGLIIKILESGVALGRGDDRDLRKAMQILLPHCGQIITSSNAKMFLEDFELQKSLLQDDSDAILNNLLERMRSNQGVKKYAVPETIQALAVDKSLLCEVVDTAFLHKYTELYRMVWRGETFPALEEMTGLLLENRVSGGKETFLRLYVSLAAIEKQALAFVFGKLQLAWLYLRQGRRKECQVAVEELMEMGLESKELSELRQALGEDL